MKQNPGDLKPIQPF